MSDYTLYHGDCLEYFGEIEPQSIDAVITDIPSGRTACAWDSVIPFEPMWAGIKRVLKPRGACVLLGCTQPFTSALVMSNVKWFKYDWVWRKTKHSNFMLTEYQPRRTHEDIVVFSKGVHTYNPQIVKIPDAGIDKRKNVRDATSNKDGAWGAIRRTRKADDGTRMPESVLLCANPNNSSLHPTQKPLALLEYLVKTYTNEGDTVLDFTFGSGTCGAACANTGRRFVGIEKDKAYFDLGSERIATAYAPLRMMQAAI